MPPPRPRFFLNFRVANVVVFYAIFCLPMQLTTVTSSPHAPSEGAAQRSQAHQPSPEGRERGIRWLIRYDWADTHGSMRGYCHHYYEEKAALTLFLDDAHFCWFLCSMRVTSARSLQIFSSRGKKSQHSVDSQGYHREQPSSVQGLHPAADAPPRAV